MAGPLQYLEPAAVAAEPGTRRLIPAARISLPRLRSYCRPRLEDKARDVRRHQFTLVVTPPGGGKTTFLTQVAATWPAPVAWYRAEADDQRAKALLEALEAACAVGLGSIRRGWTSLDDAVLALEEWSGPDALVVIDDLHTVHGTEAEAVLRRLIDYLPPTITLLVASRRLPAFDLSCLRVAGSLLEIGPDDLRFRSWEVEQLFRDFYNQPLRPEDLAELTRRTEGWPAGLQMFHLATRGRPAHQRRLLAGLGPAARLVREYLAGNVLDGLDEDTRRFMLRTSVLGRLTGPLCDALLDRTGSRQVLEELECRQIFTHALDDDGTYRYHEVLRCHLEEVLADQEGEDVVLLYRQAAGLLEKAGATAEAVLAYSRASDWEAVGRLLGQGGDEVARDPGRAIESLPLVLLDSDPWLLLARARRDLVAGRLHLALDTYRRAERAARTAAQVEGCRRERLSVEHWIEPGSAQGSDWVRLARSATRQHPLVVMQAAASVPGPTGRFAEALAACVAGRFRRARDIWAGLAHTADAPDTLATGAQLAAALVSACLGDDARVEMDWACEEAERIGVPWLVRLSRELAACPASGAGPPVPAPTAAGATGSDEADTWGTAIVALCRTLGHEDTGPQAYSDLQAAIAGFARVGAPAWEAWARSALALIEASWAEGTDGDLRSKAIAAVGAAEAFARGVGVPGALALVYVARAMLDPARADEHLASARAIDPEGDLPALARLNGRTGDPPFRARAGRVDRRPTAAETAVVLRCLGGFQLVVKGRPVVVTDVKPRARVALRYLSLHAGRGVHRETLIEDLWPEADLETGLRNLQVVISSLRRLLEPDAPPRSSSLILREGDAYRLALPASSDVDLLRFEAALTEARLARARQDDDLAVAALDRARNLYGGDLLPEDGPAEWVVKDRERFRLAAVEAAEARAELALVAGDLSGAAGACEWGLQIHRYQDRLWRLLAETHESAGDRAAALRARSGYDEALAELGVSPAAERSTTP